MKRFPLIMIAAAALAGPAAALADTGAPPSAPDLAAQQCKQLRGTDVGGFAKLYGTKPNAFGKCVSAHMQQARADVDSANGTCKTQQSDSGFAAAHDGKTFAQYYGANTQSKGKGAGADAFGKCVSQNAQESSQSQGNALVAASKACRQMQAQQASTFASTYGTKPNAFGKCVSAKSRSK